MFDRCAPFAEGEIAYNVAWNCPKGHGLLVDMCPVGPLVPSPSSCLNCGGQYPSDAAEPRCESCGLSQTECPAALGIAEEVPDDPLSLAQVAFSEGLFRRGIAYINYALINHPDLLAAWFYKSRFLHSIGYSQTAAAMLNQALELVADDASRIQLLEEESFQWAECNRGEEAFSSAEFARDLGSNSIRTHYLRGRALGLLGRLEEARDEITFVLSLDPTNADATRALKMIGNVLGDANNKRWWQFWKR